MTETSRDELFDQRIHDAYGTIELSEEAQERMLANLLSAQQAADEGKVVPLVPRRRPWLLALPIAAVLLAAFVVVSLAGRPSASSTPTDSSSVATVAPDAAEEEMLAEAAPELMATEGMDAEEELSATGAYEANGAAPAPGAQAPSMAATYPHIVAADGEEYWVYLEEAGSQEEASPQEVGEEQLGALLCQAQAFAADADTSSGTPAAGTACEVYQLLEESQLYAVRYVGEDSYWLCERR